MSWCAASISWALRFCPWNNIILTGDTEQVFNGICGAESGQVPVAAAAPAMLFSEIEVQKRAKGTQRPPLLPPPGFENTVATGQKASLCQERAHHESKPLVFFASCAGARALFDFRRVIFGSATAHGKFWVPTRSAIAASDPLLQAMSEELDRSKSKLKMDNVPAPYFIEYRLSDIEEYDAEAAFGGLREDQRFHARSVRVVVRVGDYKQDSYFGPGVGVAAAFAPLDDNPVALRWQLWAATDQAYKTKLARRWP